jgi:membrane protein DedA with SNARE-associated domain
LTEQLIGQLGYLGIALLLVLGGLGLPVPEEAPIILAAVLSKNEKMWWPLAFVSCLTGVLLGDFVVYFLGFFYGEKVLSLRLTRKFLTRAREAQIKGYFHRHGFKILILGRFAVGFRTAAYLTAGILKLPALKLFLTDLFAASLSTLLMFGLGYFFARQIEASFDQMKHWLTAIAAAAVGAWILHRYYKARRREGRVVGPPVLVTEDVPLPPDDLVTGPPPAPAADQGRALPPADVTAAPAADRLKAPRPPGAGEAPPADRSNGRGLPDCLDGEDTPAHRPAASPTSSNA